MRWRPGDTAGSCRGASFAVVTVGTCVGAVALLAAASIDGGMQVTSDPTAGGWLVYRGVITAALAYTLYYAGLLGLSGSTAALATLLEAVTGVLVATVVLHEHPRGLALLGVSFMVTALIFLGRS